MQNWCALSDPAMEEALYEMASLRSCARLSLHEPIPDETTPELPASSGGQRHGRRHPEVQQRAAAGSRSPLALFADSGPVHTVVTTAANESDVEQVADLLHGKEKQVWADSGYRGAPSRVGREDLQWHIAARPSDIAKLPEGRAKPKVRKAEHRKASVSAKVEHPFWVIKR